MNDDPAPPIQGQVAPGFEPVEAAFRENFRRRNELGAACSVSHRGETVVDLWGGYRDEAKTKPWQSDTLVLVFSTTKGLSAIAMALAHSHGYFEYSDPVVDHWPAFGKQGKDEISIRELLNHQAGLAAIDETLTPAKIADREGLMELLASKQPDWTPGSRQGYHAWSLGWYESELLRQTDSRDRRLSQFFADEIAAPLSLEFYIGLPDDVGRERIADIQGFHPLKMVRHLGSYPWRMVLALLNPWSVTSRALDPFPIRTPAALNDPDYRTLEIPAGNGIGQVRDIAKVYGVLATGGEDLGITDETIAELAAPPTVPPGGPMDVVLKTESAFNLGFWKPFDGFGFGTPSAFGAHGAGGSFAFADPERDLGFAYAPNRMGTHLHTDPRERALRNTVIECVAER